MAPISVTNSLISQCSRILGCPFFSIHMLFTCFISSRHHSNHGIWYMDGVFSLPHYISISDVSSGSSWFWAYIWNSLLNIDTWIFNNSNLTYKAELLIFSPSKKKKNRKLIYSLVLLISLNRITIHTISPAQNLEEKFDSLLSMTATNLFPLNIPLLCISKLFFISVSAP